MENSGDLGLQSSRSIARQCRHAMRLLGAYDLEDRFSRTASDELSDATAFHSWYQEFLAVCKRESLLPASHLDVELSSLFRRNALAPDDEYILYGFDPLLPSQQTLLDAIVQSGATVHSIAARVAQTETPVIIACTDLHSEIEACCQWVNQTLASDASGQVAIVVPDLTEWRPVLERSIRATVAPWLEDVTRHHDILPYEFSTGRPLSQLPMIADAMRLLQWCASAASVDDAGAVLRSRSLRLSPTPERGAELEAWCLRNTRRFRSATGLSGTITLREAERLLYKDDPTTSKALGELATTAAKQARGAHSYASLADHARALLDIAGWATCDLDSLEFQARERWNETLDRVSSLDLLGGNITVGEWLEMLAVTLNDTTFAPENTGARIQVMTPSEAAGSTSTHLWFLHASEQTWPQHASPSPLLPASLQRSLGMPGLDPLLDEAAALHVTRRCVDSASVTRFSFAAMLPTGESHVSPIVASLPNVDHQIAQTSKIATTLALEEVADVSPLPGLYGTAAGGVGILTEQAQCGFRAFAQHRLLTREMETIEAGLSAGERGDEVHTVLQAFWTVCKTHQRLLELSQTTTDSGMTARDALLAECIAQALPQSPAPGWDTAYLEVQRKRLHRLLSDWLDLEMLRSPFRVEGLEVPVPEAHIGPLHMNIRVDRIDRIPMADGSEASLLIDYKTGGAERKDWFGERPDAPQLPLYAI
ncbi:MAG: hypothetical protein V4734_11890, partial [Terriglobus sp.]